MDLQLAVEHEDGSSYILVIPGVSDWLYDLIFAARTKNSNIVRKAELQHRNGTQLVNLLPTIYAPAVKIDHPHGHRAVANPNRIRAREVEPEGH